MTLYLFKNKARGNYAFQTKAGQRTVVVGETAKLDLVKPLNNDKISAYALQGLTVTKVEAVDPLKEPSKSAEKTKASPQRKSKSKAK